MFKTMGSSHRLSYQKIKEEEEADEDEDDQMTGFKLNECKSRDQA
jgi:hypothetical protein